jgi:RND family efflux transporter MFP subunit
MKRSLYLLLFPVLILAACGGGDQNAGNKEAELTKMKKERAALDEKIAKLELEVNKNKPGKATAVTVLELAPTEFTSFVEVQAQVNGDQDVNATPQAPGTVQSVLVRAGQKVSKGQILARLDAAAIEQQIQALQPQLDLQKSLYERQQKLWSQNIGTEVQLLSAKAQYEAMTKQKAALVAQRNMYTIKSPITGTVDQVNIKTGDVAAPGSPMGIRVVSFNQLKVTATLGENYLGKVKQGNPVNLIFSDINDTIRTQLSYVSQAVDNISRSFQVEVRLPNSAKLHPNMSCKMQIANYANNNALTVPVSLIQKTAEGEMVYVVDGKKAKAVIVETGRNANGMVEVISGLSAGDKVIIEGYQELDNGELVDIKK